MTRQPIWTRAQVKELKWLYESGVLDQVIAEKLERSVSAIRTRAHLNQFRRPKRFGSSEIQELLKRAANLGLDEAFLPTNPTALRILICLAENGIASKRALDQACSVCASARNRAIQLLRGLGLVFVDKFCSPEEVILTSKAYRALTEPSLANNDQITIGTLPAMNELCRALDSWLPAICQNEELIDLYRAFIVRQLNHAKSGDVAPADFYSIIYRPRRR